MNNLLTPIAVFTYNRSDKSRNVLKSLAKCSRLNECKIFIFCDGPKNESDIAAINDNRLVVREWAIRHGATVVEHEKNLGLARSIVTGTTQLCEEFGRAILLEDDLVVSPQFVSYMLDALTRYEHDENVFQVSGYNFPIDYDAPGDAYFLPMTTSWGWATWKKKWEHFSWDTDELVQYVANEQNRSDFDLGGAYAYSSIVSAIQSGRADSWGIRWYWQVYRRKGLVLYPGQSLVWVGGLDGSGRHIRNASGISRAGARGYFGRNPHPVDRWPTEIRVDPDALAAVKQHMELHPQLLVNRGDRVTRDRWHALKRLLGFA